MVPFPTSLMPRTIFVLGRSDDKELNRLKDRISDVRKEVRRHN